MFPKLIALTGVATVGKDTFYKTLARVRPGAVRISIADIIRRDCRQWILDCSGIDCNICTPAQKEIIRPILVGYGLARRYNTAGTYFINEMDKLMLSRPLKDGEYFVLTDARFNEYIVDEPQWIKHTWNGVLVHISQYREQGTFSDDTYKVYKQPANDTEARNDPKMRAVADYRVDWETLNEEAHFEAHVKDFLEWVDNRGTPKLYTDSEAE